MRRRDLKGTTVTTGTARLAIGWSSAGHRPRVAGRPASDGDHRYCSIDGWRPPRSSDRIRSVIRMRPPRHRLMARVDGSGHVGRLVWRPGIHAESHENRLRVRQSQYPCCGWPAMAQSSSGRVNVSAVAPSIPKSLRGPGLTAPSRSLRPVARSEASLLADVSVAGGAGRESAAGRPKPLPAARV